MQLFDYATIYQVLEIISLLTEIHLKLTTEIEIHLRAIMDPPVSARPPLRFLLCFLLAFSSCTLFPSNSLAFFWHIFLRCLHILCIKESEQLAQEQQKKTQENIYFCWIIFKDKKRKFCERFSCATRLVAAPFPSLTYTAWRRKEKHVNVSRESKAMFITLGERYDYDIRAATCWREHKCLAMMKESIFRWVTFWSHNFKWSIRSAG